jgi:hypothetical protein
MQSKQNSSCMQQTQQIIPAQAPPSLPQTVQQVIQTDTAWKCRIESIVTNTCGHTDTCNLTWYRRTYSLYKMLKLNAQGELCLHVSVPQLLKRFRYIFGAVSTLAILYNYSRVMYPFLSCHMHEFRTKLWRKGWPPKCWNFVPFPGSLHESVCIFSIALVIQHKPYSK